MDSPLHPEEPLEHIEARTWLDSRVPNGDVRVVAGQVTVDGAQYVVGFTFVGSLTFGQFVETADQVEADIAAGYAYVKWSGTPEFAEVASEFPKFLTGRAHRFAALPSEWTSPFDPGLPTADWFTGHGLEVWKQIIGAERAAHLPDSLTYFNRRLRRLNAFFPIHR